MLTTQSRIAAERSLAQGGEQLLEGMPRSSTSNSAQQVLKFTS